MANKKQLTTLTRRADFLELKETGRRLRVNSWLLVNWRPTERNQFRVGWTLPRQIGSAVIRNRMRRWAREFFRRFVKENAVSLDLNLIWMRREKDFYSRLEHKEFDEALQQLVDRVVRRR